MSTDDFYNHYYVQQAGSGLPVYGGVISQRGHGLGSILGGLFRSAMPLLKNVGKAVGKQVLKSGLDVANDVVSGVGVKNSVKRRATEGAMSLLAPQQSNKRYRTADNPITSRKQVGRRARRKRVTVTDRDIFA